MVTDSQFTIHNSQFNARSIWNNASYIMSRALLTLCIMLCASVIVFAQFSASTPNTTVSTGDQFQVTFTLNGSGNNFHAPTFAGFSTLMGPSQSTSMQIINGNVSQTLSFTYVLQAEKEGTFTIG